MIQENKFIFKFIYGVLIDELCESAQLITNQDLSRLAKSLENTHVLVMIKAVFCGQK